MFFLFCRGPIGILRFEFGVCTQGMVGPVELTCEYIKEDQIDEVGIFTKVQLTVM